jgi:HEAT repeat protein
VCLNDPDAETRVQAIRLTVHLGMNLLEQVVALLTDPQAEVRRAALLAVGAATEVLATDDLLVCLHDPDAGVRRLCEQALLGRGLETSHIQLGRLMTNKDAKTRLQVLDRLRQTPGLEASVWLRRLSHDPSPAVRAAAIRAVSEFAEVDLSDRINQIAQTDPNFTVRQLAQYYLSSQKPANRPLY